MGPDELVRRAPRLFHTTPAASWPGIAAHGLLPVSGLLDRYGVTGAERERLLTERRPRAVRLQHPEHGTAWLRDQRPLNPAALERMLEGCTVAEYLRRINGCAFLWADPDRLARLHALPRYASEEHVVIAVDTASLLAAHGDRVLVSRINSGAALFARGRRGPDTLLPLDRVPSSWRPVEVAVPGGVPDLAAHLVTPAAGS
ncbi:DUF7002 family protein [Pseudonocardia spirodelae]|uniref:Uncharacterized protein n=1 Tax=Pseudonocardia spirodelae TaxID=3133431 RepID=A0ABU8T648_9PSEU